MDMAVDVFRSHPRFDVLPNRAVLSVLIQEAMSRELYELASEVRWNPHAASFHHSGIPTFRGALRSFITRGIRRLSRAHPLLGKRVWRTFPHPVCVLGDDVVSVHGGHGPGRVQDRPSPRQRPDQEAPRHAVPRPRRQARLPTHA